MSTRPRRRWRFAGRLGGRTLKPGGYRLLLTATPAGGGAPAVASVRFTIV